MTRKERRIKVLNATVKAFNIKTRCVDDYTGLWQYHIEGKQGCAVGRLIKSIKLKKRLDEIMTNSNGGGAVSNPQIFKLLPKNVKVLGKAFLTRL
jgi:hypothetical protein